MATSNAATGKASVFEVDPAGGSTYEPILNQVNGTLTASFDLIDVTNKSNGTWKTYIPANKTVNISLSGHIPSAATVDLNGTDEYFHVADDAALDLTTAITIQANIVPDAVSGVQILAHKHDGTDGYILQLNDDQVELVVDDATLTTASTNATTNADLVANTRNQIKAIYNGGGTSVKIYVNGVSKTISTTGTIPATCGVNATRLTIGTDDTASGTFFNGEISKIAIAAVSTDSASPLSVAASAAYYMFEGNGNDETSNALNLTAVGIAASNYSDLTIPAIKNAWKNSTPLTINLDESGTGFDYSGSYYINNITKTYPDADVVTYDISAQLTGDLTITSP